MRDTRSRVASLETQSVDTSKKLGNKRVEIHRALVEYFGSANYTTQVTKKTVLIHHLRTIQRVAEHYGCRIIDTATAKLRPGRCCVIRANRRVTELYGQSIFDMTMAKLRPEKIYDNQGLVRSEALCQSRRLDSGDIKQLRPRKVREDWERLKTEVPSQSRLPASSDMKNLRPGKVGEPRIPLPTKTPGRGKQTPEIDESEPGTGTVVIQDKSPHRARKLTGECWISQALSASSPLRAKNPPEHTSRRFKTVNNFSLRLKAELRGRDFRPLLTRAASFTEHQEGDKTTVFQSNFNRHHKTESTNRNIQPIIDGSESFTIQIELQDTGARNTDPTSFTVQNELQNTRTRRNLGRRLRAASPCNVEPPVDGSTSFTADQMGLLMDGGASFTADQMTPLVRVFNSDLGRRVNALSLIFGVRPSVIGTTGFAILQKKVNLLTQTACFTDRNNSQNNRSRNADPASITFKNNLQTPKTRKDPRGRLRAAISCNIGSLVDRSTSFAADQRGSEIIKLRRNLSRLLEFETQVRSAEPRLVESPGFTDRQKGDNTTIVLDGLNRYREIESRKGDIRPLLVETASFIVKHALQTVVNKLPVRDSKRRQTTGLSIAKSFERWAHDGTVSFTYNPKLPATTVFRSFLSRRLGARLLSRHVRSPVHQSASFIADRMGLQTTNVFKSDLGRRFDTKLLIHDVGPSGVGPAGFTIHRKKANHFWPDRGEGTDDIRQPVIEPMSFNVCNEFQNTRARSNSSHRFKAESRGCGGWPLVFGTNSFDSLGKAGPPGDRSAGFTAYQMGFRAAIVYQSDLGRRLKTESPILGVGPRIVGTTGVTVFQEKVNHSWPERGEGTGSSQNTVIKLDSSNIRQPVIEPTGFTVCESPNTETWNPRITPTNSIENTHLSTVEDDVSRFVNLVPARTKAMREILVVLDTMSVVLGKLFIGCFSSVEQFTYIFTGKLNLITIWEKVQQPPKHPDRKQSGFSAECCGTLA